LPEPQTNVIGARAVYIGIVSDVVGAFRKHAPPLASL
jgi:rRNA processing protein Gar1